MKKNRLTGIVSVLLLTGVLVIIFILGIEYRDRMYITRDVIFSHESGFYEEAFQLQLSANAGGEIYYTLDGSEPDRNSYQYQEPILITDASNNPNIYSMRTDLAAGFMEDKLEQYTDSNPGYEVPKYNIDKATIVRAIVYYDNGECGEVVTASYFVGFDEKDGYDGMNIVSIVTDPENLFGYETGIYVTGKTFDMYWESFKDSEDVPSSQWWWWQANYRNKGIAWEREAECQFFDTERNLMLKQSCGIRTRGGSSRGFYPRGLNLYARAEYDGNATFSYPLFTDSDFKSHSMSLTQGGGEYRSKLKDYLFSTLTKDLAFGTMDFEPYVMFLNGEYWGVYWLTERYDEKYLSNHYGVYEDNVIIIKNDELEAGEDEDLEIYYEMVDTCAALDMTNDANYEEVCELIDMDSYLDYYAAMLYVARRGDWPLGNWAAWRTRQNEDGEYGDCKWRWMVFDMNSGGMMETDLSVDAIESVMKDDAMFRNLMNSATFRKNLIERIKVLDKTIFNSDKVDEKIDVFLELMETPIKKNHNRFYGKDRMDEFHADVESVRTFYNKRSQYLNEILEKYE